MMTENEFLLHDRIHKIRQVLSQYGQDTFAMSWSGGKDSCVMSALVDMAVPGNDIPRVYADTGLDLRIMREFVDGRKEEDPRICVIKPSVRIHEMLAREGYPFSSKNHSRYLDRYQRLGVEGSQSVRRYLGEHEDGRKWHSRFSCPKCLRYQFTPEFTERFGRVSDKCCLRMKEEPLDRWRKEHGLPNLIIGTMQSEGGRRFNTGCLTNRRGGSVSFQPLAPMTKEWEGWFIREYDVQVCDVYRPPYNLDRTGCKGCPFNLYLQRELDTLERWFPEERRQCERIWGPVYEEYRRIGYRLMENGNAGS